MTETENAKPAIRVLCADDHPLVRKGIAAILANEPDLELVAETGSAREAVALHRLHRPDVTLMDLRLPEGDGIAAVTAIRAEAPDARIIVLTSYGGDQEIQRALAAGVSGYLLKEMAHTEVVRAIRTVHAGKRYLPTEVAGRLSEHLGESTLTPREIEVLALVAAGLANKQIAARLGTADGTVKMHVQNILEKLGAADRTQAVTIGLSRGIIHLDR